MTRSDVRRVITAHDAVWDGWWPTLLGLDASVAHRSVGGSFPSVFATTKHMVEAEIYWQHRCEASREHGGALMAETMAEVEAAWRQLQSRRLAWLEDADPSGEVAFETDGGEVGTVSMWECLIHIITHAHFHRGQLVSQCRVLGVSPPSRHFSGAFIGEY
jgi:uncharacterized damage-inducible protein DinB